jgi:hypothetical protein
MSANYQTLRLLTSELQSLPAEIACHEERIKPFTICTCATPFDAEQQNERKIYHCTICK